ncbi:hypothetical protein [Methylocucumis oryzae]|uniref:PEP-CTERM protein-sorting domain-containing protein n=1 Tax=Methylocucumis oryzae TaxID=1632867 RepID=A0A0F3IGJ9_9GAMM|nr:hypothetical protein [Methylocucumis oryzae]KJV05827.1 hypothetical protein VZ94_15325 [Methylocucumis oryzae]
MKNVLALFVLVFSFFAVNQVSAATISLIDNQDGSSVSGWPDVSDSTKVKKDSSGQVSWLLSSDLATYVLSLSSGSSTATNVDINWVKVFDSGNNLVASTAAAGFNSQLSLTFYLSLVSQPFKVVVDYTAGLQGSLHAVTLTVAQTPVPAAIWLFGSALLGLVSVSRRKAGLSA